MHVRLPAALGYASLPLSLFQGCVRKANFSCLVRRPQMRPCESLRPLFGFDLRRCPGGRCVRAEPSEGVRQQVSKLVIQCLEQRLHCLSRRKALQCASGGEPARRSGLEGGRHRPNSSKLTCRGAAPERAARRRRLQRLVRAHRSSSWPGCYLPWPALSIWRAQADVHDAARFSKCTQWAIDGGLATESSVPSA